MKPLSTCPVCWTFYLFFRRSKPQTKPLLSSQGRAVTHPCSVRANSHICITSNNKETVRNNTMSMFSAVQTSTRTQKRKKRRLTFSNQSSTALSPLYLHIPAASFFTSPLFPTPPSSLFSPSLMISRHEGCQECKSATADLPFASPLRLCGWC